MLSFIFTITLVHQIICPPIRLTAELEGGALWQTRNEAQIPNDSLGTRFSLVDLVGKGPLPWVRLYLTWNINKKHNLYALLAPLSYTKSGILSEDVNFAGESFNKDSTVYGTYKFNSWRVGYYYNFYTKEKFRALVGFTAKIRDAKIALKQGSKYAEFTDLGFVPLLHLGLESKFTDKLGLLADLEGLAGGPGRAFDGALKVFYQIKPNISLSFGYRTVEGGADVPSVYNFGWIHYALLSVKYRF